MDRDTKELIITYAVGCLIIIILILFVGPFWPFHFH